MGRLICLCPMGAVMPTIRLTAVEGHTDEQFRAFMDGATRLAQETLGAREEAVIVQIEVLSPDRYMRGGKTIQERRAEGL